MKKILITGGCGFIGSNLAEYFVERGYKVRVFDRYNSNNNWGWLENSIFKKDIEVVLGDIRDYDSVSKALRGYKDVLHLAALIGIPYSYISPLAYIKTNVEGTYNILEASKHNNIDELIVTSTSEVYGSAKFVPINEQHPIIGQSPYSASKIAADQLSVSYYRSFNFPIKIIRPFNTFGPRQSARAIIPTIFSQLYKNNLVKLGNIFTTRDFIYVKDLCIAYEKLLLCKNKKVYGNAYNVGNNEEISIKNLFLKIQSIVGNQKLHIDKKRIRQKNSEVERLKCDYKEFNKITKWKPKFTLDQGLNEFNNWFKNNTEHYKSNIYNI